MPTPFGDVLRAAKELPESERIRLVESLMATLAPEEAAPLDDAWLAEIERRSTAYDAGHVELVPWSQVKQQARQRTRKHG